MIALDENDPKHRAFSRLAIAQRDIGEARRAIQLIKEFKARERDDLYERLVSSAVVSYCRPFVTTKQYPGIASKFRRFENQTMQAFHDEMILFRNRFIAHCDAREIKVQILPKGTEFRGKGDAVYTVARHGTSVSTRWFRSQGLAPFEELCAFQLERLGDEIASLSHRLFPTAED
jgi:hypothetical protein